MAQKFKTSICFIHTYPSDFVKSLVVKRSFKKHLGHLLAAYSRIKLQDNLLLKQSI